MKRFRIRIVVLFALAMLATAVGPAAALTRTGTFTGVAKVGKVATFCNHDGTSNVSGAGLGLVGLPQTKNAFYSIDTNDPATPGTLLVISGPDKSDPGIVTDGFLRACGRLGEVGKGPAALGAACEISKGYHGKGVIGAPAGFVRYWLQDITWKTAVAGTFPFYASGQPTAIPKNKHGRDLVTGVLQTLADLGGGPEGFQGCPIKSQTGNKQPNAAVGARRLAFTGTFDIVNNAWSDPQQGNKAPGVCKKDDNPLCLYKSKKPQTTKNS